MPVPSELVPALSRAIETMAAIVTSTASSANSISVHALDRDAHQRRRVRIAAHREHVAPEARAVHDERQHHRHHRPDQHRNRDALGLVFDEIW